MTEGLRVGDFVFQPGPALETDDTHDNPQNDERRRARQDDARAAQRSADGGAAPAWSTGPRPVTPRSSLDDALDGAREKARDEAAGAPDGATTEVPILLHNPLTGELIGTG